ncbi:hypothetical protein PHET_08127 [Paragonimus heterotremus]|uniref:Rhodanese domain-containing protein n=1 Tax=Paragonimus heterotremus TaxID=100268 RepID=A0A8J4T4S4_9TREM|nr:hypothetical protein PHET_08127 [Paragonimus heterotremus]
MAIRFAALRFYSRATSTLVSGTQAYAYDACCSQQRRFSVKHQNVETHKDKFPESLCGKRSINYYELSTLLNEYSVFLIDVRETEDFTKSGHIPGAINIPRESSLFLVYFGLVVELKTALTLPNEVFFKKYGVKKPRHSDENIVFYGLSDVLSSAANEIAHGLGQNFILRDGPAGLLCCRNCNCSLIMTENLLNFCCEIAFSLVEFRGVYSGFRL